MFGYKLLLAEKDKRINDLLDQIQNLRMQNKALQDLSIPKKLGIPAVNLEADAILSGKDEIMEVESTTIAELDEINSEASRILSGNY